MLLSTRYSFIYIKTRKTGSTSVEIALSKYCAEPNDVVTPILPEDERIRRSFTHVSPKNYRLAPGEFFTNLITLRKKWRCLGPLDKRMLLLKYWNHVGVRTAKIHLSPKEWSYFKFTVERDPWDKLISGYYYLIRLWGADEKTFSFREFFDAGWAEWFSDFHLYTNGGCVLMDRVINYDRLQEGLTQLARELKLPEGINLHRSLINAKSAPTNANKDSTRLFDDELIARVRTLYAREIEMFGFRRSPFAEKERCRLFLC